jgi:hypothetical protein
MKGAGIGVHWPYEVKEFFLRSSTIARVANSLWSDQAQERKIMTFEDWDVGNRHL